MKSFAAEFDRRPFHRDEERARDSIFQGSARSGCHTAAFIYGAGNGIMMIVRDTAAPTACGVRATPR